MSNKLTLEQMIEREKHIVRAVNRINFNRIAAKRERAARLRDKRLNDDFNEQMRRVEISDSRRYRYLRYRSKTY